MTRRAHMSLAGPCLAASPSPPRGKAAKAVSSALVGSSVASFDCPRARGRMQKLRAQLSQRYEKAPAEYGGQRLGSTARRERNALERTETEGPQP